MIEQIILGIAFCIGFYCTACTIVNVANSVVNDCSSDMTAALMVASVCWGVVFAL